MTCGCDPDYRDPGTACTTCVYANRNFTDSCNCNVGKYSNVLGEDCNNNCDNIKCLDVCEEVNGNCGECSH